LTDGDAIYPQTFTQVSRRKKNNQHLFIGGLPKWFQRKDVLRLFEGQAEIERVDIHTRFCFVKFRTDADKAKALALNGTLVAGGKVITIEENVSKMYHSLFGINMELNSLTASHFGINSLTRHEFVVLARNTERRSRKNGEDSRVEHREGDPGISSSRARFEK
jgi:hypothetical protein